MRFVSGESSVIIDSGPPSCADKLRELLADKQSETLVVTHLDDDHYGGLHALLKECLALGANAVNWPKKVIVNHFEPDGAIGSIRTIDGGADGGAQDRAIIDRAIAAGNKWRNDTDELIVTEEWDERDGRDAFAASAALVVDEQAFEYIAATENQYIDFREIHHRSWGDDEAHRLFHRLLDRIYGRDQRPTVLFDDIIVRRNPHAQSSMRFHTRDRFLREQLENGIVPAGLPPSVRGLLHLKLHGTALLQSARSAVDAVNFIEALRLLGIQLAVARVGDQPIRVLGDQLRLHILGPDAEELRRLAKKWDEIRGKLKTFHVGYQRLAFVEATMVAADIGRYSPDPSVTNRSSIQLLAETDRACAVLTGDGIPETLERTLRTSRFPSRECRIFKAAHHGSDHNIDLRQLPNRLLSVFKPEEIWVSGFGEHHPARNFLAYLCAQPDSLRTRVLVTNRNDHVTAMSRRLRIMVMRGNEPFVCAL